MKMKFSQANLFIMCRLANNAICVGRGIVENEDSGCSTVFRSPVLQVIVVVVDSRLYLKDGFFGLTVVRRKNLNTKDIRFEKKKNITPSFPTSFLNYKYKG